MHSSLRDWVSRGVEFHRRFVIGPLVPENAAPSSSLGPADQHKSFFLRLLMGRSMFLPHGPSGAMGLLCLYYEGFRRQMAPSPRIPRPTVFSVHAALRKSYERADGYCLDPPTGPARDG